MRSHFNGRPWGADTSSYNMTSSINPTYRLGVLNHSTDTHQVGWSKVRSGGLFTHPTRTGKIPGTCRSRTIQGRSWWSFRPSYAREQVEGAPGTRLESVWSQGDSSAAPQQVLIQLLCSTGATKQDCHALPEQGCLLAYSQPLPQYRGQMRPWWHLLLCSLWIIPNRFSCCIYVIFHGGYQTGLTSCYDPRDYQTGLPCSTGAGLFPCMTKRDAVCCPGAKVRLSGQPSRDR